MVCPPLKGKPDFYEDYYDSPQYQAQAGQARNQQLAASEATGGLGATSTQNQLARIAPTLGLQALGQQQSLYGDLTNLGYGAAGSSAGFYGQSAQSQYGALQNIGNIQAAKSKAPLQTLLQVAEIASGFIPGGGGSGVSAGSGIQPTSAPSFGGGGYGTGYGIGQTLPGNF